MPIFPRYPHGAELFKFVRAALVVTALCISGVPDPARAGEAGASIEPAHTNRLIDSNNPYLLLHAHNPVDWYPWGPEALEKARREQKPIFLSVGYSTCYWCRVAEETIYSRQEFAEPMNAWFVNIKVDREQRPDIDRLYMAATQALTGRGGWPNNVFLTPDLKPFFAGSYFPPHDDASGRPGFDSIIRSVHAAWTQDPDRLRVAADKTMVALRDLHAAPVAASPPIDPRALLGRALAAWVNRADNEHGGFGPPKGPRFPQQPVLSMLMADPGGQQMDVPTGALDAMAAGGIYDHLGGGFHRYATEPTWSIPHFEKMLADNAQLLEIYAKAFILTGNPRYRLVATETAAYLTKQMMASGGGFYTAQDAVAGGHEGSSYLWTRQKIVSVLGDKAAADFFGVYALTPLTGVERVQAGAPTVNDEVPGVLRRKLPIEGMRGCAGWPEGEQPTGDCTQSLRRLLEARDGRPQPARDEKLVVAFNGLAIQAFARAGGWLGMPQYIEVAGRAAETMWTVARDQKRGLRHEIFNNQAQADAFPDDYALLGLGFLALYEATADTRWLQRAGQLGDELLAQFQRADGSLATTAAEKDLPVSLPEDGDGLYPSGSAAAVALLLRLERITDATRYGDAAQGIVDRLGYQLEDSPESWPAMLQALVENDFIPARSAQGPLVTEAVVRISAALKSGVDHDVIMVTLQIADGYHVNANPASFDYLIATSVTFDGLTPTHVIYPEPMLFKPAFAPAGLKVYEGKVNLEASFPKGAIGTEGEISAVVSTQACNSEICLPPAKLIVTVARDGSS